MSWDIHVPRLSALGYPINFSSKAGPITRLAPNFNGISQLAEYPGKLIDVDNLNGLILEGYFAGSDGTLYSQNTSGSVGSREFQIYIISSIICVLGGTSIPVAPSQGAGVYRFEFTATEIRFSFDGVLIATAAYTVGAAREADALFRIGARGNGSPTTYGFFTQGLTYNHRVGDAVFNFDDGWSNNPTMRNTGSGADGTFINMTEAAWQEIPA